MLGVIAPILASASVLFGVISQIRLIIKKQASDQVSLLPSVFAILVTILWIFYGFEIKNQWLAISSILNLICFLVLCFTIFTYRKKTEKIKKFKNA